MFHSRAGHKRQYGARALHAAELRLHIHLRYSIFIAFPHQQYLHERVSILSYSTLSVLLYVD